MKKKFLLLLALGAGVCLPPAYAASPRDDDARVIVKFKADGGLAKAAAATSSDGPRRAKAMSSRLGIAMRDGRQIDGRTQQLRVRGMSSAQLAKKLAAQADVEYAVVDHRRIAYAVPNDPLYPAGQPAATPAAGQWYLRAPNGTTVSAINAEGAWDIATGAGVVVAVLDTGIRPEHPDLAGKLLAGYDFVDPRVSNDGDGYDANPADPGDWTTSSDPCTEEPSSWHGTQTAGLVGAASRNGIGMAGSGGDVKVLPVRVLGKCGGYDSDIIAAMLWAGGRSATPVVNPTPAKVLNLSFGSQDPCTQAYVDAITELNTNGVVVVASAGNEGLANSAPANCAGVIGVAGVRHTGTKVGYSNVGSTISIAAPAGNCVVAGICQYPLLTTTNSGTTYPVTSTYSDGNNASLGTSFAAPLVSGTAALMFSVNPTLTAAQVRTLIRSTSRTFPSSGAGGGVAACQAPTGVAQDECYCTQTTCGEGMLDAHAAVVAAAGAAGSTAPDFIPLISYNADQARTGASFTLDSSATQLAAGATGFTSRLWSLVGSPAGVQIVGSAGNPSVVVQSTASDAFVLRLSMTDDLGNTETRDVRVVPNATLNGSTPPPASDGGGGGAMTGDWLLGLLAGIVALHLLHLREQARRKRALAPIERQPRRRDR